MAEVMRLKPPPKFEWGLTETDISKGKSRK